MSLKRLSIAVLLGLLAFAVVLYWPASPRWVLPDSKGPEVIGPCLDGSIVLLRELRGEARHVVARRLNDGKELWRFDVPPVEGRRTLWASELKVVARGTRLWAKYQSSIVTELGINSMKFAILDARTGARVHGPFTFNGGRPLIVSACGRWMASYVGLESHWLVYSAETGVFVKLKPPPDFVDRGEGLGAAFAPDSASLAVVWGSPAGVGGVGFYDPATGRLLQTRVLPANNTGWGTLSRWEANTLLFQSRGADSDEGVRLHSYSVDIVGDRFGRPRHEEALEGVEQYNAFFPNEWNRVNPWLVSDRVVREIQGRQVRAADLWWQARNLCDRWFKTKWGVRDPEEVLIQILTRDAKRLCFSVRSRKDRHYISPDARWVATVDANGVKLWNADPWPRWPWALGAGAVVAAMVMFLKRRRGPVGPVRV